MKPATLKQRIKRRLEDRLQVPTMERRVRNLRTAGFQPRHIIDVGAYQGAWAELVAGTWPEAKVLMIEPQESKAARLASLAAQSDRFEFRKALVSASSGEVSFAADESNSRIVTSESPTHQAGICKTVATTTLDEVVAGTPFESAEFLKLDVQGHELEVLAGASQTIANAEVVLVEISILRIGPVPLFAEVHQRFTELGFQLYDLLSPNYRPLDKALWQIDAIFARPNSRLLASRDWG